MIELFMIIIQNMQHQREMEEEQYKKKYQGWWNVICQKIGPSCWWDLVKLFFLIWEGVLKELKS